MRPCAAENRGVPSKWEKLDGGTDQKMSRFGELCIMENEMKIRSQLDETKLKLDSSSLYYEVDPTGPAPARSVRICSLAGERLLGNVR